MKVRILTSICGHAEPMYDLPDFCFAVGDVVDLHDGLASAWIKSGIAEEPPPSKPVTRISAKAEAAAKSKAKEDSDAAVEQATRETEIAQMLVDHPQPEAVALIAEARISGSPMHLVAARIAAEQAQKGQ